MGFIEGLPLSDGHDIIMVVVCHLTKMALFIPTVKYGFSDPTKEQEGRDRPRKDIMNRHQVKALREGCHERKEAQMGVSSREKINTNRNLVRVTTKSKSEMQTVSNGRVSRGERDGFSRSVQTSE